MFVIYYLGKLDVFDTYFSVIHLLSPPCAKNDFYFLSVLLLICYKILFLVINILFYVYFEVF